MNISRQTITYFSNPISALSSEGNIKVIVFHMGLSYKRCNFYITNKREKKISSHRKHLFIVHIDNDFFFITGYERILPQKFIL